MLCHLVVRGYRGVITNLVFNILEWITAKKVCAAVLRPQKWVPPLVRMMAPEACTFLPSLCIFFQTRHPQTLDHQYRLSCDYHYQHLFQQNSFTTGRKYGEVCWKDKWNSPILLPCLWPLYRRLKLLSLNVIDFAALNSATFKYDALNLQHWNLLKGGQTNRFISTSIFPVGEICQHFRWQMFSCENGWLPCVQNQTVTLACLKYL